MSKYLRKEKARGCPVHMAIMDECSRQLSLHGVFQKDAVLEALNLEAMTDAVRWDYIRSFLEDELGCEMVPLASVYFKRHRLEEERVNPQRFIATGHGKKTAGFATVTHENDHLYVSRIEAKKSMANGVGKAFEEFVQKVSEKRAAIGVEDVKRIA
jgi:hypothetical protein